MRTTLNVDEQLFDELMRITSSKTKTEAVRIALNEYVRLKRKEQLLSLRGQVDIADNWERMREMEIEEIKGEPHAGSSH